MSGARLGVGFIPLVDSAPLVVAHELGFAAGEGLELELHKSPSWSMLRDMLNIGQIDAAHMLAPVPVAQALGIGNSSRFDVLSMMSINGNVTGVSTELAAKMRANGFDFSFTDAYAAGKALIAATGGDFRIGVPFPFSMHAELLYYWLSALGHPAPQGIQIRTVPPPMMAQAIAAGEIDAFCVGEPWGSISVENGVGELLLPGAAIWAGAPEKVLAVRHDWAEQEKATALRLIRAVWKAGRWLAQPDNRIMASEILARPAYLNVASDVIDRALNGELIVNRAGDERRVRNFVDFYGHNATFPWKSQAAWIGSQLASRVGMDRGAAETSAAEVFRTDLYREALSTESAALPQKDYRSEGESFGADTADGVDSQPFGFFDRRIFERNSGT
ncbi:ABC transporter substrate-binding protein [Marivivens aquimaris]|uniref:ABC transporter substrate-binding protein n=1 Tax=Marivivens aquimaris TaxID=2774876 RepID=UPI001880A5DE|nr:ABC transporter substrate-binding protein [Marivivens aquimaris]